MIDVSQAAQARLGAGDFTLIMNRFNLGDFGQIDRKTWQQNKADSDVVIGRYDDILIIHYPDDLQTLIILEEEF